MYGAWNQAYQSFPLHESYPQVYHVKMGSWFLAKVGKTQFTTVPQWKSQCSHKCLVCSSWVQVYTFQLAYTWDTCLSGMCDLVEAFVINVLCNISVVCACACICLYEYVCVCVSQYNRFFYVWQTIREFVELYMCVQDQKAQNVTELNAKYGNVFKEYEPVHSSLPESVDWRTAGAVTSVKDQVGHLYSYILPINLEFQWNLISITIPVIQNQPCSG